jgi:hypothetical protein
MLEEPRPQPQQSKTTGVSQAEGVQNSRQSRQRNGIPRAGVDCLNELGNHAVRYTTFRSAIPTSSSVELFRLNNAIGPEIIGTIASLQSLYQASAGSPETAIALWREWG